MKTNRCIAALIMLLAVCCLQAVEPVNPRHVVSVHTGYANMLWGTGGLTDGSRGHERSLSSGVSWDAQYYFNFPKRFAVGLLYSGYSAEGALPNSSDHVYTHYIAPQFGFYCLKNNRWNIRLNAGYGYLKYLNNSVVYEKDRQVSGRSFAANIGGDVEYKLTSHWGISADIQLLGSKLWWVNSNYHGEDIQVRYPDGKRLNVSRLNVSAGLTYSF